MLSGCDTQIECIEADSWGQQVNYSISGDNNKQYIVQPDHTQIGKWNNTGYVLDGSMIIGVVKNSVTLANNKSCSTMNKDCQSALGGYCYDNSWTAWFGDWDSASQEGVGICGFRSTGGWCPIGISMQAGVPVTDIPCLFTRGLGLFAFVSDNYNTVPNAASPLLGSQVCNKSNISNCFVHVGAESNDPKFFDNYCPAGVFRMDPPMKCQDGSYNCGLSLKISDRYYNDNDGGYKITFKQGVKSKNHGVLTKFAQLVTGILCDSTTELYQNIVSENSFRSYARVLLILYIAFIGVGFVIGVIKMTHTELIVRVLKVAIVIQVATSATSWQFFNDNFYSFFTNGVGEITGILFGEGSNATSLGVTSSGKCAPNVAGIQAFDDAIAKLFSIETTRKIMTLMVWKIYGFLYIAALYAMILIILYAIIKAVLVFFVSYLAISIIIVLGPIFIPFILFKLTRSFFENWLKQLISYFIQPIIILTFAFFMITILMGQLEFLFGYRVCWKHWFTIPVIDVKFFAWQADYNNDSRGCLATPNAIMSEDSSGNYKIEDAPGSKSCGGAPSIKYSGKCMPYMCYQDRYIGFPYLDPDDNIDSDRISELQGGDLMSFKDLVVMFVMVWFMVKFNTIVPALAKRLAGSPNNAASVGQAASGMAGGMQKFAKEAGYMALNPAYRKATGGRDMKEDATSLRKKILMEKPGEKESEAKTLKTKRDQLMAELKADANNKNVSLEEKTKKAKEITAMNDQIKSLEAQIKAGADGSPMSRSFLGRSKTLGKAIANKAEGVAQSPGKALLGVPKAVGRSTIGVPLRGINKLKNNVKDAVIKKVKPTPPKKDGGEKKDDEE